tara:strand:+ start:553 stop:1107 length:555 start_codon:yes stop_codon:yes gene_type:complete
MDGAQLFTNPKQYQVMVDIETLSTRQNAAILSIGATKFNIESGVIDTYYQNIDASTCKKYERHVDKGTIEWWGKQSKEAVKQLLVDVMPFDKAIHEFRDWYGDKSIPIWGNSAGFDVQILESAMYSVGYEKPPWMYWHIHCFKTATNLVGVSNAKIRANENDTHHNALDDAISQTNTLVTILRS